MKRSLQGIITLLLLITTIHAVSLAAQQQANQPLPANKIEGTITAGLSTSTTGMPSFTLKTKEGEEYIIHLGTLKNTAGEVFAPKVGDTIAVVGTPCCGMAAQIQGQSQAKNMIHAAEITLGEQTYRAVGSMGCMMMGAGQPGQGMQGMMMGQGPAGAGQPGQGMMMQHGQPGQGMPGQGMPGQGMQGMMMCPGMTGQPMPGQVAPGPAQAGPGAMAPGPMGCCGGTAASGACAGCSQQQPPAATPAPVPEPEPEMEHMH